MTDHYSHARLRRGVAHFLWGKASSALLNFCGFLLVARLLEPLDYGRYVALISLVELCLNLSSFGLDWVSTRYIPEFRVQGSGAQLVRFVVRLTVLQACLLAATASALAFCAVPLAELLGLSSSVNAMRLYALYLLLEGLSRVLRDQMLSQLLLQGRAQLALVLRHLLWVSLCGAIWISRGRADIQTVACLEIAATALGLAIAVYGLGRALRAASQEVPAPQVGWCPPQIREVRSLAFNSYLGFLLNIPARPQMITLLIARVAGVEVAGIYGFARNLTDQVLRFLPAELLLGFIRPVLIAKYVASRDFGSLNKQTNALLTISLLVLMPLVALAVGQGQLVVQVLGAGRFPGGGVLLAVMLLSLVVFSHRRILEFISNVVSMPEIVSGASVVLPLVFLLVGLVLALKLPIWCVPMVSLMAEVVFGLLVVHFLRKQGFNYILPLSSAAKLLLATIAGVIASHFSAIFHGSAINLIASAASSTLVSILMARVMGIFTVGQFIEFARPR